MAYYVSYHRPKKKKYYSVLPGMGIQRAPSVMICSYPASSVNTTREFDDMKMMASEARESWAAPSGHGKYVKNFYSKTRKLTAGTLTKGQKVRWPRPSLGESHASTSSSVRLGRCTPLCQFLYFAPLYVNFSFFEKNAH